MTTATSTADIPGKRKSSDGVSNRPWFRFELTAVLLSFWYLGGLFIDGWAHNHGRTDETFFTAWHAVFYSGFAVVAAFYAYTVWSSTNKRIPWSKALPKGHHLSLIGVAIFGFGGLVDMIWHETFGVEEDIEALLSPAHLTLALGMFLVFSGAYRAFLYRSKEDRNWKDWITPTLSMTFTVSVLLFFIQYLSPTGAPIGFYFEEGNAGDSLQVYIMNPDGTGQTRLFPDTQDSIFHAVPSPDGERIAYAHGTLGEESNIYVANFDDSGTIQVTDDGGDNREPAWSPDGSQLVYTASRGDGFRDIYVFNFDTMESAPLTDTDTRKFFPAWSPDGTQIAYTVGMDESAEIYLMNADGSGVTQITDNNVWESFAQWSPDGESLAITRDLGETAAIFIINLDGEEVEQVTDSEFSSYFPVWSNDGSEIIYTQYGETGEDIMAITLASGEIRNLSNNPLLDASYAKTMSDGSIVYRVQANEGVLDTGDVNDLLLVYSGASMLIYSAVLVGGMMLLLREGRPPFGAMTILWTAVYLLVATQDDGYHVVPIALIIGFASDILIRVLNVRVENGWRFIGFAFLMPVLFFSIYFAFIQLVIGISWTVDVWSGSIVIAGAAGALIAYIVQSGNERESAQ